MPVISLLHVPVIIKPCASFIDSSLLIVTSIEFRHSAAGQIVPPNQMYYRPRSSRSSVVVNNNSLHINNMSTPTENPPEVKAQIKDEGRDSRLSFRQFAEHKMRREFKDVAIEKCRDHMRNFGQCAQDNGLLVVFKCRDLNRKINDCMMEHNSPEQFEEYLKTHADELEKRTIKSKV